MSRRAFDRRAQDRGLAAYHDARYKDAVEGAIVSAVVFLTLLGALIHTI